MAQQTATVREGDTVEVTYEGSYRGREHTVTGDVREIDGDVVTILDEGRTVWHEVFDYEHNDETRLLRSANTQAELGTRHGTTRGTVVRVEVQG